MNFIFTATGDNDNSRLHLLKRDTEYQPFVVCWNYDPSDNSWNWGTYCNTLKKALTAFIKKCDENGFTDIFEGYADKK